MTTWKEKARPALERALGHGNFAIKGGHVIGDGIPEDGDLHRVVLESMKTDLAERVAARKAQIESRSKIVGEHFQDAFRLCDGVIFQAMRKFGGSLPAEITAKDPQALAWGIWLRDMKRAIDAGDGVPELLPYPPLPSWFEIKNPGTVALCERLGVEV